jgi:hypothetical protein
MAIAEKARKVLHLQGNWAIESKTPATAASIRTIKCIHVAPGVIVATLPADARVQIVEGLRHNHSVNGNRQTIHSPDLSSHRPQPQCADATAIPCRSHWTDSLMVSQELFLYPVRSLIFLSSAHLHALGIFEKSMRLSQQRQHPEGVARVHA